MNYKAKTITMADPYFDSNDRERIHQGIDEILDQSLSMGPNVRAFELEFAAQMNVKHAIAMNSCTSTLEAALLAHNVLGKEVIIPSQTFIATGMAVHLNGGTPVFAEISPETMCLDIDDVKSKITPNTVGIVLVHMTGIVTPNIMEFKNLCDEQNLFLVEDAAHAPGALVDGKFAGTIGDVGCFSFFPSKVITSGEGGMLVTNNDEIAGFAKSYQNRGRDMSSNVEIYNMPGRNVRMTEMSALLGRIQLEKLDDFLEKRRVLANIYKTELSEVDGLDVLIPKDIKSSSFWKVPVILNSDIDRLALTDNMRSNGVSVDWAYNPPLHLQPVFMDLYHTFEGQLPVTESCLARHICLPCHPRMTESEALYAAQVLKDYLKDRIR
ncbi:DegT/DnrJ/EryC1/StrS family aminotransferase [Amylibacter sp.]|nr:DegT/DnrJ/EryC1/StrS family aminotransferase [Amylibacter sp.]